MSADRPEALAELAGIVLNDGVKLPTVRIQELHFGEGTPYETHLRRLPEEPEPVLRPEVATVVREALFDVVERGTGRRARVLVPHPPEFRWMAKGETSPWFPGFTVYRQRRDAGWKEAVEALARDLAPA